MTMREIIVSARNAVERSQILVIEAGALAARTERVTRQARENADRFRDVTLDTWVHWRE